MFFFPFIPHPAEYGVGEFFILCHCPDAGVSVGIDLVHFWSARGGVGVLPSGPIWLPG